MLSGEQMRWRAIPTTALTWREWDGEFVVFNHETGSTHLLDELAGTVLRQLSEAEDAATVLDLVAALMDDPSASDQQECARAVTAALTEFARLGLAHAEQP